MFKSQDIRKNNFLFISQLYFNDEKAGYASAVGIMTFFIIMIVALPVNAYLRKKEVEY